MADMAQIFVEHPHFSVPTIQEIRPVNQAILELETSLEFDETVSGERKSCAWPMNCEIFMMN